MKTSTYPFASLFILLVAAQPIFAQEMVYPQLDVQPLSINPAFTGMCDGNARVSAFARTQWRAYEEGNIVYGASADLPVYSAKNGDYLGAGGQYIQARERIFDEHDLVNSTGVASLAYHKLLCHPDSTGTHGCDLSLGLQAGYAENNLNVGSGNNFITGVQPHTQYYKVNAGISFSQSLSSHFNYVVGASAFNIDQPQNANDRLQNSRTGLDTRYIIVAGANWRLGNRLTLRPAALYQSHYLASALIIGNEFHFITSRKLQESHRPLSAVFIGVYYTEGDAFTCDLGVDIRTFRIGIGHLQSPYDVHTGGFRLEVKYIMPDHKSSGAKRTIPCNRF